MMPRPRRSAAELARSLLARIPLLGILWWAFVEGEVGGWIPSGLAVLTATLASYPLIPVGAWRWRVRGVLRFLPFFLRQSARGGIDVAARALHPRLPVLPGFIEYPLRLPEGPARVFFVNSLNLLPGTLSAELRDGVLRVHLLHRGMPARERIEQLEGRVAALFGVRS
jgi:multicomponent Na+:H+ antiporter subunit E